MIRGLRLPDRYAVLPAAIKIRKNIARSCTNPVTKTDKSDKQGPEQLVERYFDLIPDLRKGDEAAVDALVEMWAPDGVFEFAGGPPSPCVRAPAPRVLAPERAMHRETGMRQRTNRYTLGALLAFLALNAFAGGYYALAGAEGVPAEWLEGSAFSSYLIPGLILLVVVGGFAALAAVTVLGGHRHGFDLAKLAGWILIAWLCVQLAIIGPVSWLQPTTGIAAIAILWLTYRPEAIRAAWRPL